MGTEGISVKLFQKGSVGESAINVLKEGGNLQDINAFLLNKNQPELSNFFLSLQGKAQSLYGENAANEKINKFALETLSPGIDSIAKQDDNSEEISQEELLQAMNNTEKRLSNAGKTPTNPTNEIQQPVETQAQVEQKPAEVPQATKNTAGTVVNEDIGTALEAGQRILEGKSSPKDEAAKLLKKAQEEANSGNIETSKMYRAAGQTFNLIGQASMNIAPDKRQQFINDCLDVDQPKGKKRGYTPEFNIDDIKKMQGDDNIMNYEDMGKIIFTNAEKYGATVAGKKIMKMKLDENP
jgi:hypothetical protein